VARHLSPLRRGASGRVGALCLLLATLLCLRLPGAGPAKPRRTFLRVPVILDAKGAQLPESAAPSFTAKLDGVPARVLAVRGPTDDLIVLVVMDVAAELSLVDLAKDALITAIGELPPKAYVGVLRAQDGLRVLVDPTTNRGAVSDAIRSLTVSGKAGLLDSVETSSRLVDAMLAKAKVRAAVVYVTDSSIYNYRDDYTNPVINGSDQQDMSRRFPEGLIKEKISKLENKLARYGAPLFIVHLAYSSDRLNEAYQSGLMSLASASGGASVFCRSRVEIPQAIANTFRLVASHYSLDLQMPAKPSRVLQVQLEAGGHSLVYRSRFVLQEK
jgi:hypothetical protein